MAHIHSRTTSKKHKPSICRARLARELDALYHVFQRDSNYQSTLSPCSTSLAGGFAERREGMIKPLFIMKIPSPGVLGAWLRVRRTDQRRNRGLNMSQPRFPERPSIVISISIRTYESMNRAPAQQSENDLAHPRCRGSS